MKILILMDERWDSGITNYTLQVSKILMNNKHQVVLGLRPGGKPEKLAKALDLKTTPIDSYFSLKKIVSNNDFDVINPHTGRTHTWAILTQMRGSRKKRIPIVRTRGDAREVNANFMFRYVYRKTQGVIAASDHVRKQYEIGFGMNEEKARTVYPAVSTENVVSASPKNRVGILGRLDPVKGHTFFLEAAAKVLKNLPQVKFLISGREANVSYQVLKNQSEQLNIQHAVEFLGFQPSASEFMRGCSFGVIASIGSEEVSRACLEWMGAGKAVIGTLVGCLPELIEPRESGLLVPPGDSSALGDAMITLLKNENLINSWGRQAHYIAEKRFSESVLLDKTLRMFQWAIKQCE